MPFKPFLRFIALLGLGLSLLGGPAHAEKADKDKPMNIEADNMRHDESKMTTQLVSQGLAYLKKPTWFKSRLGLPTH